MYGVMLNIYGINQNINVIKYDILIFLIVHYNVSHISDLVNDQVVIIGGKYNNLVM